MDNKAQMMVLESIIFTITVVIALLFLVQLSPTSIQESSESTINLKTLGDDALNSLYTETAYIEEVEPGGTTNNPTSKLAVCIITNDYSELTNSLNDILPSNALYNIYVSNGTKTVFWCSSNWKVLGDESDPPLPTVEPITISHHIISIDPIHLTGFDGITSDIAADFSDYDGATYDVILEMWTI